MDLLILFLLFLVLIKFLPQFIYLFFLLWIIASLLRIYQSIKYAKRYEQTQRRFQEFQKKTTRYQNGTNHKAKDEDIIDVEYTERDYDSKE